eukprot:SAG22_NODE_10187_length_548_cov_1.365256_2_plen_34_part_01
MIGTPPSVAAYSLASARGWNMTLLVWTSSTTSVS